MHFQRHSALVTARPKFLGVCHSRDIAVCDLTYDLTKSSYTWFMASLTHVISMPCTMKVRVKWPNAACSLHLKVGVERPKFLPHDFVGQLTQTTIDHVPRPFFLPTQNKNGKKRSGNARLLIIDLLKIS